MRLDGRRSATLLVVGLGATTVFLLLLGVTAGCMGPCGFPFWVAPLLLGLFLAGPVAAVIGIIGVTLAAADWLDGVADDSD